MEAMIQPINSCTISPESQTAETLLQPAQSFQEVLVKQIFSDEKNAVDSSTVSPESQRAENLLQPAPPWEGGPQKQPISEEENEGKDKDVESGKVAAVFPLNLLPILPSLRDGNNLMKIDPSQVHPLDQPLSQSQENELRAGFLPTVSKGQENPIFLTGITSQNTPWAMKSEVIGNSSSKADPKANLLGQKITLPGVSTDSPLPLEFDEKLNFLLGQSSTGGELPGQSLNGEFSGSGNSSAEKNSLKVISGGENHHIQDSLDSNALLGGPKPQPVVEETGGPQKLPLSKAEHVDLYQQVAEKVIWSIRHNQEWIRLNLEPPQLGNLFIELHRDKEEIKATLWVDNPKTKEILENNQFQLQKNLEGHGFKLEKYDVFLQNGMASFQGKEEKPVFQGTGSPEKSLPIHEAELGPGIEILPGAIPMSGGSQYIDRFI